MAPRKGVFLTVEKSRQHRGKVEKRFRFLLEPETATSLKKAHDSYVGHMRNVVEVPKTAMSIEEGNGRRKQVVILQDDLSSDGMLLADLLKAKRSAEERVGAYVAALRSTLSIYEYSKGLANADVSIESNPKNWWIRGNGTPVLFDTTPPMIAEGGRVNVDVLVPKENPDPFAKVQAWIARAKGLKRLAEKTIRKYAFGWPTIVQTLLIKTVACAPKELKKQLIKATREEVKKLGEEERKGFEKKLTWMGVNFALLVLKAFDFVASPWMKNEEGKD